MSSARALTYESVTDHLSSAARQAIEAKIESDVEDQIAEAGGGAGSWDEIVDLIAEAAVISPHASLAYRMMQDHLDIPSLKTRQELIAGRMGGVIKCN